MEQPQPLRLIPFEVGEDRIRHANQVVKGFSSGRGSQIERQAPAVAVERLEIEAVTVRCMRWYGAADVSAPGRILDLDDLRPQIGKQRHAIGTGTELRERQDSHTFEWSHGAIDSGSANGTSCPRLGISTLRRNASTGAPC